jgi:hypothetical protein
MLSFRLFMVLVGATLLPKLAAAQPTPCPQGSSTVYQGELTQNTEIVQPIFLQPCHVLTITAHTTATLEPISHGAAASLTVYNNANAELFADAWSSYPTNTRTIPSTNIYSAPYRGTRGAGGLPSHLKFKSTLRSNRYVITVTTSRRPDYNKGGPSFGSAAYVTGFPKTIYASIQSTAYEPGQYFKLRLAAGGQIRVSGSAQASAAVGANLYVRLYTTDSTLVHTFVGGALVKPQLTFTSGWFTNTSATPKEYVLKVAAGTWMIWDLAMSIEASEGPKLTLFLDADGNFNPGAPASDHLAYVPGADLSTGASVALPQPLTLIAAYVSASGQIVAPPYGVTTAGFSLDESSAFPGDAMNHGSSTAPDYSLAASSIGFGTDNTARVSLICSDYGGYAVVSTGDGFATNTIRLPDDIAESHIPAGGWKIFESQETYPGSNQWAYVLVDTASGTISPQEDLDDFPSSNHAGDNLIAFEEYRGFFLKGRHHRFYPARKDVLILNSYGEDHNAFADADQIGVRLHRLFSLEMSDSRRINFNHAGIEGHSDQQGLILYESEDSLATPIVVGAVPCDASAPPVWICHPNIVGIIRGGDYQNAIVRNNIRVSNARIAMLVGPNTNPESFGLDSRDYEMAQMFIGHEVGHALGIWHNPDQTSIMKANEDDPGIASFIAHQFKPEDIAQLRLK